MTRAGRRIASSRRTSRHPQQSPQGRCPVPLTAAHPQQMKIEPRRHGEHRAIAENSVSSVPPWLSSDQHGCELWLFQPRKASNMDFTFCLNCVHACPYDNVGLIARTPTSELWTDPYRSGIGRFSRRADLAAWSWS